MHFDWFYIFFYYGIIILINSWSWKYFRNSIKYYGNRLTRQSVIKLRKSSIINKIKIDFLNSHFLLLMMKRYWRQHVFQYYLCGNFTVFRNTNYYYFVLHCRNNTIITIYLFPMRKNQVSYDKRETFNSFKKSRFV